MPDPSAQEDLSHLVAKLGPDLPAAAREIPLRPASPQPDFTTDYRLIATPQMSLEAAAEVARKSGLTPLLLGDALEGRGIAAWHRHGRDRPCHSDPRHTDQGTRRAAFGRRGHRDHQRRDARPRRAQYRIPAQPGPVLDGHPGIHALAADTDGIDGTEDAAGAIIGPEYGWREFAWRG